MSASGGAAAAAEGRDHTGGGESRREWLRAVVPPAVAIALLFGLVVAGGLALRDLVDLGVWLLSSR